MLWVGIDSSESSQPIPVGWDQKESRKVHLKNTSLTFLHSLYYCMLVPQDVTTSGILEFFLLHLHCPEASGHFGFPLLRIATSFGVFNCLSLKFSSWSKCSTVSTCLWRDMPTWSYIHNFPKSSVQSESYDVDGRPKPKYRWKELKDVKHQSYMLPIKCYPPLVQYQPIKSR